MFVICLTSNLIDYKDLKGRFSGNNQSLGLKYPISYDSERGIS